MLCPASLNDMGNGAERLPPIESDRGQSFMRKSMSRRHFMASTAAASLSTLAIGAAPVKPAGKKKPIVVASGGGLRAVEKAMELVRKGHDPLDAAIEGVAIVEADPKDHSVGLGGLPNEDGVVELDAAVMHGPTHGGGSVASIRNIIHPAAVARLVMLRTRHCLLVGEGALRFARAHGFPEVDLLTDESRRIWLHWKETRDPKDDWLPPPDEQVAALIREYVANRVTGTIHCSVLDTHGDLACTTTTSGLAWKIPGRVGDSPILGRRLVSRQRGGLGRLDGRGGGKPLEPVELPDRRRHAAGPESQGRDHGNLQTNRHHQHSRPEAPASGRSDHVQRVVLCRQQERHFRRGLDLPWRQDGRTRRRCGEDRRLRPAFREMSKDQTGRVMNAAALVEKYAGTSLEAIRMRWVRSRPCQAFR